MTGIRRILLVDDHVLFREGLRRILQEASNLSIVAEAGTAAEGLALARKHKPDVVLLDISLPDKSGLDLLPQLRDMLPRVSLIVVSMHRRYEDIVRAFQAGAKGYVSKDSASDSLLAAIHDVLRGEIFLDPSVSKDVLARLLVKSDGELPTDSPYGLLTTREQEVMRLIAEGCSIKAIAGRLCISSKTVDCHRANIMRKLALESTVDIIRYAARLRLIDLDTWKA